MRRTAPHRFTGIACWRAVALSMAVVAAAAPASPAAPATGPKPATAAAPATKLSGPAAALVCQGCHGVNGAGAPAAKIPRIAGQSADYLDKELRDYASGARSNPVMQNFAKPLSDVDRAAVASYFASQTAPYAAPGSGATPAQLARGHQLAHQGSEAERVQACNNCHGPEGSGEPYAAPYLAGQSADYLAAELQSWRQGIRSNDAGKLMSSVAQRLNDADVAAIAAYYASLGVKP